MRASELAPKPLLIIVHPGSCCGSADFNLGHEAKSARSYLCNDIVQWMGDLLVIDGNLSDELPSYPQLDGAIKSAIQRCNGRRIFACAEETPNWPDVVALVLYSVNRSTQIEITGAWYSGGDDTGCVNTVYNTIREMGFMHLDIRNSVIAEARGIDYDGEYVND